MAGPSLTQLLVPTFTQLLEALSHWLDKAQAHAPEVAESLLGERLAPDMYPLSSQVCFVCVQVHEALARLQGEPFPEVVGELLAEGRNPGSQLATMAKAQAYIEHALSCLGALGPRALDAGAERELTLELATGHAFDFNGEQFARDWALPQFYFHLNTAYAILRHKGVPLGKADYVRHMGRYVRG